MASKAEIRRVMRRAAILIAALLFIPGFSFAWIGKVVGVINGDTLEVLRQGRAVRIRLYGVDCPEKRQDFGQKANRFASSKVFGARVRVKPNAKDRYGRTVAIVFPKESTVSLNQMLVKNGLAWVTESIARPPNVRSGLNWSNKARDAGWAFGATRTLFLLGIIATSKRNPL